MESTEAAEAARQREEDSRIANRYKSVKIIFYRIVDPKRDILKVLR